MNQTIAIITCWYGPYPWYLPYFIHSCSYNASVDFYIITDNKEDIPNLPGNVHVVYKTLEEIKTDASEKLGFSINIEYPYKLCDYKPAYGYLFPEIVKNYTFWGQSDMDVIYGDLRKFLDKDMLNSYDFISVRHDYTSGCFALYKNNLMMNTFFMRSRDFKTVFSNPEHFCFDECNFVWDDLTAGKSIFETDAKIESFTHLIRSAADSGEIKAHFDFILVEGIVGKIKFDHGKIIYKNEFEGILYHLYWLKRVITNTRVPRNIPHIYFISPKRIYF